MNTLISYRYKMAFQIGPVINPRMIKMQFVNSLLLSLTLILRTNLWPPTNSHAAGKVQCPSY